jgi:hypothetical protein
MCHNKSINENFWEFEEWNEYVKTEAKAIRMWHEFWIDKAASLSLPVYFIRFEDMLTNPSFQLKETFKFIFC